MGNLLYQGKWLRSGLVDLHEVVHAKMMLNDREGQKTIGPVVKTLNEDLSMRKLTTK